MSTRTVGLMPGDQGSITTVRPVSAVRDRATTRLAPRGGSSAHRWSSDRVTAPSGPIDEHVASSCKRAALPGGDPAAAAELVREHADHLTPECLRLARLQLWRTTGDTEQLREAKRLLDDALARTPEGHRRALRTQSRVNREILAAWEAELGRDDGAASGCASRGE